MCIFDRRKLGYAFIHSTDKKKIVYTSKLKCGVVTRIKIISKQKKRRGVQGGAPYQAWAPPRPGGSGGSSAGLWVWEGVGERCGKVCWDEGGCGEV